MLKQKQEHENVQHLLEQNNNSQFVKILKNTTECLKFYRNYIFCKRKNILQYVSQHHRN